jgi:hypothetical protein
MCLGFVHDERLFSIYLTCPVAIGWAAVYYDVSCAYLLASTTRQALCDLLALILSDCGLYVLIESALWCIRIFTQHILNPDTSSLKLLLYDKLFGEVPRQPVDFPDD